MPSQAALERGAAVGQGILQAHRHANSGTYPETVAVSAPPVMLLVFLHAFTASWYLLTLSANAAEPPRTLNLFVHQVFGSIDVSTKEGLRADTQPLNMLPRYADSTN